MQIRTVALASGVIAIVGALGGAHYFGGSEQAPFPPAIQSQLPMQTTAEQAPPELASSEQAPTIQARYESENSASQTERLRRKKLIQPASVEPGSSKAQNVEHAPASDVHTQAEQPPSTDTGDQHPDKKAKHKTDEPGPAGGPP
jgi:type IV secretory pathway VirB10-like protein